MNFLALRAIQAFESKATQLDLSNFVQETIVPQNKLTIMMLKKFCNVVIRKKPAAKLDICHTCVINMPVSFVYVGLFGNHPVSRFGCLTYDKVRSHSKLDTSQILGQVRMLDPVLTSQRRGMKIQCRAKLTLPRETEPITGTVAEYTVPNGKGENPLVGTKSGIAGTYKVKASSQFSPSAYVRNGFHSREAKRGDRITVKEADGETLLKRTVVKYCNALITYKAEQIIDAIGDNKSNLAQYLLADLVV